MAAITVPNFDLTLSGGGHLRAADLSGRPTVLYFYPKDSTSGCTLEAQEFSRLLPQFRARGVEVYGVSPDSTASHDRFVTSCELTVPLVSDPDRVLCEAFDVWRQKSMYGRSYMGVERSTFLLGATMAVAREWRHVTARGHAQAVLEALDN